MERIQAELRQLDIEALDLDGFEKQVVTQIIYSGAIPACDYLGMGLELELALNRVCRVLNQATRQDYSWIAVFEEQSKFYVVNKFPNELSEMARLSRELFLKEGSISSSLISQIIAKLAIDKKVRLSQLQVKGWIDEDIRRILEFLSSHNINLTIEDNAIILDGWSPVKIEYKLADFNPPARLHKVSKMLLGALCERLQAEAHIHYPVVAAIYEAICVNEMVTFYELSRLGFHKYLISRVIARLKSEGILLDNIPDLAYTLPAIDNANEFQKAARIKAFSVLCKQIQQDIENGTLEVAEDKSFELDGYVYTHVVIADDLFPEIGGAMYRIQNSEGEKSYVALSNGETIMLRTLLDNQGYMDKFLLPRIEPDTKNTKHRFWRTIESFTQKLKMTGLYGNTKLLKGLERGYVLHGNDAYRLDFLETHSQDKRNIVMFGEHKVEFWDVNKYLIEFEEEKLPFAGRNRNKNGYGSFAIILFRGGKWRFELSNTFTQVLSDFIKSNGKAIRLRELFPGRGKDVLEARKTWNSAYDDFFNMLNQEGIIPYSATNYKIKQPNSSVIFCCPFLGES